MSRLPVDFIPTPDPILRDPRLEYGATISVLGLATTFETNSRYVIDLVEETFGAWRAVSASRQRDTDATAHELHVRIVVIDGSERCDGHAPVRHICPDAARVLVHTPGSLAVVDPERGQAIAYVTTDLAADRAHFRYAMLEAMTLALLTHFDRHPIHAAAIGRGDRAVLLFGPSGAGKSTMAYIAHAAGLEVLSDDKVWVQLKPSFTLWGWPEQVHLLPDASTIFPELSGVGSSFDANGKQKIAVNLERGAPRRLSCERAVVCLLDRAADGHVRASLDRVDPQTLSDAMTRALTAGFDRYPERLAASVAELTRNGGWLLTRSDEPRETLPLLRRMLDET